ncbi:hypothetical protein CPLU01_03747 [Colletotrichum plurivorum]|uniref:Uncharacterized protein n=1 Tax=Colletotrichum plurivorum TaxID=2175906 RepID=A0A8H6KR98_9PEZI|nr:hypothetical protein CPLU01_03747 [Colletotrichum plurivorum]
MGSLLCHVFRHPSLRDPEASDRKNTTQIARSSRSHDSQLRLQPVETSGRIGTSQDMDREGSSRTSTMISEAIFSSSKACVVESVPCDPRTGITSGNWHRSAKLNTPAVAASISGPFARSDAHSRCWSAGSVLA